MITARLGTETRTATLTVAPAAPTTPQALNRRNVANILGFENGQAGAFPAGWSGSPAITVVIDDKAVHGGRYSARIERTSASANQFTTVNAVIPVDFTGKTIEWRGYLKTENTSDAIAIWMREDGDTPNIAFATTQGLGVKGTNDWKEYSITLNLLPAAKKRDVRFPAGGNGQGLG